MLVRTSERPHFFFCVRFQIRESSQSSPTPGNASLCARNLAPFGDRAVVLEAALWSENTWLTFDAGTREVGAEAGVQIRPLRRGEAGTVHGVDVPTALAQAGMSGSSRIGAENKC
jgi:hypothetical protein